MMGRVSVIEFYTIIQQTTRAKSALDEIEDSKLGSLALRTKPNSFDDNIYHGTYVQLEKKKA